jgi:hypothetical protein
VTAGFDRLRCVAAAAILFVAPASARAGQHIAISAIRVEGPLVLDGTPDEPCWETTAPFTEFVQQVPKPGAPATDRTEVRVLFDDDALYIGVRAFQAGVPIIANELRRDNGRLHVRNDTFTLALDTFHDRRNGYIFIFNPLGAIADWATWDEGRVFLQEWDAVWDVRTAIESWGWSAEMRLPFRSLRFKQPGEQRWGITFRRIVLAKNEWSYATVVPPEWSTMGIAKFSSAAELEGVTIGSRAMNLELTPYVLGGVVEARCEVGCAIDGTRDVGVDAKYGVTSNLTLDLTYNTDFSQVEADEQQINFTRFNLFFPEKRQFFLEGKGIFDFGITGGDYRLLPFFSRRIGLEGSEAVPIVGGARLTGKAGRYSVGALGIGTEAADSSAGTRFGAVRVKRDVLSRSSIGFIATDRRGGSTRNQTWGADAHMAFGQNARVESFISRAWTPEREADSWAGRVRAIHDGDLWVAEVDYLRVGRNYDPQVGFVRRRDVDRWFGRAQVSPRPRRGPVRKVFGGASLDYARDGTGRLETRELEGLLRVEFHSADVVQVTATRRRDVPAASFRVGGGLTVAAGGYSFTDYSATWTMAPSRRASGNLSVSAGDYYDGTRREFVASSVIVKGDRHFYADVNYQVADVALPTGSAVTQLFGVRLNYSATTRLFKSTLLQWNTSTSELNVNVRLNWIYRPGSNLYVVYSRTSGILASPLGLQNQSFIVKITRLLQF